MIKAPYKAPHYNNKDRDYHQDKNHNSYILFAASTTTSLSQSQATKYTGELINHLHYIVRSLPVK